MNNLQERFDLIIRKLKANGQKLTPQRLAIVKTLIHSEGHPTVEMIYEQLRETFPTMSLATVYRNVLMIKSLGEVLELGFPDGSNRYDGKKPYPHPHAVCIQCKKIIDPDVESLANMTETVAKQTGFKIVSHRLDFFGICPECLQQR